jgi:glycosyltransferase involved in cell wall biosynthesis
MWVPSGGFRVVYEYANRLANRGHQVTVVHPRTLNDVPKDAPSLRERAHRFKVGIRSLLDTPIIDWHTMDARVGLKYVPNSHARHIPDADVLFATAWTTVASVLACGSAHGEKCYFLQAYETWLGPKELVDATWHAPLHKIVVSKWLRDLGRSLDVSDLTYIPNAIDHQRYRLIVPIENRPRQVVMVCSPVPLKGSPDGIKAIEIAKAQFPDLRAKLFGNSRRPTWVPSWMEYTENPPQDRIVKEFYNGSSVLLSSSVTEGFALPPAEAAACGCAIVSTDSGGIRDFVQDGVTGLLSPPNDAQALAKNLCRVLGDDDLRTRLARSANRFVVENLQWENSADLMEQFLSRVAQPELPLVDTKSSRGTSPQSRVTNHPSPSCPEQTRRVASKHHATR